MTEDEAKTKWCCGGPMQFLAASTLHSGETVLPDEGKCLGRACMAWRWHAISIVTDGGVPVETYPELVPYHRVGTRVIREGHCGLAGNPSVP